MDEKESRLELNLPLGTPVEPDVYTINAVFEGDTDEQERTSVVGSEYIISDVSPMTVRPGVS